jgi:hypothetical protein
LSRIFISYAHVDYPLVVQLVDLLRAGNHDPWFDHRLVVGRDWKEQLREAIVQCDGFLYALTPESVTSEWCQWEMGEAVKLGKPIIPVLLQAKTQVPDALKRYQYADFSDGQTPIAVARLMSGLTNMAVTISPQEVSQTPANPQGTPAQALPPPIAQQLKPIKQLVDQKSLSYEDISILREYLNGSVSPQEKWDVIRELGKPGWTNVIPLLQEIIRESHDYNSRHLSTVALGVIGPAAQTALLEALEHTEPSVRWTALQSLSKLPASPVIISKVRDILKNDSEWLVRSTAIDTLGELSATEAVDDLISLLRDSPVWVRRSVASVLGKFNTSEVKAVLRHSVLNDPEQEPRLWAIESLVELRDIDAISIFETLRTGDPDEHVRKAAANAYFRSKNWPQGAKTIQVRSQMLQELGFDDGIKRVKKMGFFNSDRNKDARGLLHQYERLERQGEKLVVDHTTGLTWQQSGSPNPMVYIDAPKYIRMLNDQQFAGYDDWRLPTLDEAMSLMEFDDNNHDLHIDLAFDETQTGIWTADQSSAGGAWDVDFFNGTCEIHEMSRHYYVRAVR